MIHSKEPVPGGGSGGPGQLRAWVYTLLPNRLLPWWLREPHASEPSLLIKGWGPANKWQVFRRTGSQRQILTLSRCWSLATPHAAYLTPYNPFRHYHTTLEGGWGVMWEGGTALQQDLALVQNHLTLMGHSGGQTDINKLFTLIAVHLRTIYIFNI